MNKFRFHLDFWKWYSRTVIGPKTQFLSAEFDALLEKEFDRVAYWLPLTESFKIRGAPLSSVSLLKKTGYSYDLHRLLQPFPKNLRFCAKFGDNFKGRFSPIEPTFVKARKINSENPNWVLLPMDTHRHFQFPCDLVPWEKKRNMAVWRGAAYQQRRKQFIRGTAQLKIADIGSVVTTEGVENFVKPHMAIAQQHTFKFIISLEGNDVATNLKWIMASNSLCMMPKPTYETWFMEGTLLPGIHYAEIAADGSDLEEKVNYYLNHQHEARQIVREAQRYLEPFRSQSWNLKLGQAVAYRYFQLSDQLPSSKVYKSE